VKASNFSGEPVQHKAMDMVIYYSLFLNVHAQYAAEIFSLGVKVKGMRGWGMSLGLFNCEYSEVMTIQFQTYLVIISM
jgi:hypothetical protein